MSRHRNLYLYKWTNQASDLLVSTAFLYLDSPNGPGPPYCWGFEITFRHIMLIRHLWMSDQPVTETSIWQRTTVTRYRHKYRSGIRTRDPSKRAAADRRLRTRGHQDRFLASIDFVNMVFVCQLNLRRVSYSDSCKYLSLIWNNQTWMPCNGSRLSHQEFPVSLFCCIGLIQQMAEHQNIGNYLS
jgi:hypothetical protein